MRLTIIAAALLVAIALFFAALSTRYTIVAIAIPLVPRNISPLLPSPTKSTAGPATHGSSAWAPMAPSASPSKIADLFCCNAHRAVWARLDGKGTFAGPHSRNGTPGRSRSMPPLLVVRRFLSAEVSG